MTYQVTYCARYSGYMSVPTATYIILAITVQHRAMKMVSLLLNNVLTKLCKSMTEERCYQVPTVLTWWEGYTSDF